MKKRVLLAVVMLVVMLFTIASDVATVKCAFQNARFVTPRKAVATYKCWVTFDGQNYYTKMYWLNHVFPPNFTLGQDGY